MQLAASPWRSPRVPTIQVSRRFSLWGRSRHSAVAIRTARAQVRVAPQRMNRLAAAVAAAAAVVAAAAAAAASAATRVVHTVRAAMDTRLRSRAAAACRPHTAAVDRRQGATAGIVRGAALPRAHGATADRVGGVIEKLPARDSFLSGPHAAIGLGVHFADASVQAPLLEVCVVVAAFQRASAALRDRAAARRGAALERLSICPATVKIHPQLLIRSRQSASSVHQLGVLLLVHELAILWMPILWATSRVHLSRHWHRSVPTLWTTR